MKNLWASSAMSLGIVFLLLGIVVVVIVPFAGIIVGVIPLFFGIMGLRKFKSDPGAGGKPKAMIGIFIGGLMILVSLYLLISKLFLR